MKYLITTIAAVVLVGCGESQQPVPAPEAKPVEPVAGAKAPVISIHDAAAAGNIEAVKKHLAAGSDVNAKERQNGGTPLHYAALLNNKKITELLISEGADVNAKDDKGKTPLDAAIIRKGPEIADLIRKNGGKTSEELKTEASFGQIIKKFYAKYNIGKEYQISFNKLVEISKGEDDRSNILEGLKFFQIEDYNKAIVTQKFFTPDDEAVPGPPSFLITQKYVLGEYLVDEADFPTPEGGIKKITRVLTQLGDTEDFLMHAFDSKIFKLALITKTSKNKFSTQEVGIKDNGQDFTIKGSGIIRKGVVNSEFEVIENGMIMIKNKTTVEYE